MNTTLPPTADVYGTEFEKNFSLRIKTTSESYIHRNVICQRGSVAVENYARIVLFQVLGNAIDNNRDR